MLLLKAFKEYHEKTCIRFRPYEKGDKNWIVLKGNYSGCWSSVGRRLGGQVLNLNAPKCVTHGVIVHELLHALGFYHQQSATERDDYIKVNWENIIPGHEHNFNKYARTHVSNFGVEYDYQSVMHYSSKAFTKNGENTIEPLDPNASFGQRKGLSQKDIAKLNKMYEEDCNDLDALSFNSLPNYLNDIIDYFQGTLNSYFRSGKFTLSDKTIFSTSSAFSGNCLKTQPSKAKTQFAILKHFEALNRGAKCDMNASNTMLKPNGKLNVVPVLRLKHHDGTCSDAVLNRFGVVLCHVKIWRNDV
ncbi:hypothetical protein GQX74_010116 [Glossina fuscipes]|nr:hypothetical protein GQX74_010116 [Glossina fuscipes]